MKSNKIIMTILCLVVGLAVVGCAQKPKTANSSEAIKAAKSMEGVEAQAKYLISEANAFVSSKQFDDAINAAKYVLSNLDQNSMEAQKIIEKAKAELEAMAKQKAEEMKAKLGGLGK